MRKISVKASHDYDIFAGHNILSMIHETAEKFSDGKKALIVSDTNVFPLYGAEVSDELKTAGYETAEFIFEAGERSKNTDTLSCLWEKAAGLHMSRSDIFVALGGGVAGDLAGFAAATYLRGIKYINIPTSLLSMVDSSVGGKTAVDLKNGKNLAGAFWPPAAVICDTEMLETLPEKYFSDGMAEVIKYGMINMPEILDGKLSTEEMIIKCIEDKKQIVEADEHDNSIRQLLNFGHTAGHAIERCSGYTVPHGTAVGEGMIIMTKAAVRKGICDEGSLIKLKDALKRYSLPEDTCYSPDELYKNILSDKKIRGNKITAVIPETAGRCVLKTFELHELYDFIAGAWEYGN